MKSQPTNEILKHKNAVSGYIPWGHRMGTGPGENEDLEVGTTREQSAQPPRKFMAVMD